MSVDVTDKAKSLKQLQAGLKWVTKEFKEIYFNVEEVIIDGRWEKMWERINTLDHIDEWLRSIHGFKGCIWGEEGCPEEQPTTCIYCVDDAKAV